ncbi:hypothetical protein C8R32_10735 [Nitrosospira sp. Nsp5]|uniref:Uncharacterized protein n=1 Tax=Nitrosospira multiformis TaxID=1231 RepID=A0ABY0T8Z4_9PROT|nr:hypothetical protein C8R32_10735 [Nitrosospira sp. Nsp5]SDQ43366.1 hypothetical protein SAMN05216402_0833 [Nitrosospira multiformis]
MVSFKQFSEILFIKLLKFSTEVLNLDSSRVLTCIEPHGRQPMPLKSMLRLYCMHLPWPGEAVLAVCGSG